MPRAAWPVDVESELPGAGAIEDPGRQNAVLDQRTFAVGNSFAVEGLGTLAAHAVRIVDDADPRGEDLLAQRILEEAHAPRDRGARDGAGEMADDAGGDTRIVDDRDGLRLDLARSETRNGAFAGALADGLGAFEVAAVTGAGAVVVAFHRSAVARQHGHADGMVGARIAAEESFAGGKRHGAAAEAGAAAFRIGDALDRHGGAFDGARPLDQRLGRRLVGVFDVERRPVVRQHLARREACVLVFRREPRHRHRPFRKGRERVFREVARRDEGDALSDEDAQAQIVTLRALDILELAKAVGDAGRHAFDEQPVGGVGAGGFRGADQRVEDFLGVAHRGQ